jgi:hypothetical protein
VIEHSRIGMARLLAAAAGGASAIAVAVFAAWVAAATPMLGMFSATTAYPVLADFFAAQAVGSLEPV